MRTSRLIRTGPPLDGLDRAEIAEYRLSISNRTLEKTRILLEVPQPYPNHNGGAIHFGPDKMLYVALGDGGWRNDPEGHGQNGKTLLGSILRLNVSGETLIPSDNPFVGTETHHDLIWINGVRNPWKFTILADGRLIVRMSVKISGKRSPLLKGVQTWGGVYGRDRFAL